MDLAPGTLVDGKYRVVRPIGRGGMGAVYEVENVRVRKTVAMKVLSAGAADDVVRRFEKEAQAAGRIGSEHIVEVHDLGTMPGGEPYMVMEYLEGETLRARLHRDKAMTVEAALPILVQLLEGLGAAHAAGIVHRDLKPENVYLVAQRGGLRDWVKILDFGISKFSAVSEDGMTKTGQVIGTPQYMAPEQIKAPHLVDGRTDVYAVGVIFYQLITGQIPFKAKTYAELLFKIVYEPLPHPTSIVPELDASYAGRAGCEILLKAMAREPDHRHQSAAELRDALLDLASRIGAPVVGETTSSTRAFLRASGHAMPVAPGVADARSAPRLDVVMPSTAHGAPGPTGPSAWTPASASGSGFGRPPATTQLLSPPGGTTPHPALAPAFGAGPPAPGGSVSPTPNPSFGGVPVTTQAPVDPDVGRKAAVAGGAAIVAVALGVLGFVLTRPEPAPASGAVVAPVVASEQRPAAPAEPPAPIEPPAPADDAPPIAEPASTGSALAADGPAPPPSASAPPAITAAPTSKPAGNKPPRPPRPPAQRPTSVLGY